MSGCRSLWPIEVVFSVFTDFRDLLSTISLGDLFFLIIPSSTQTVITPFWVIVLVLVRV